MLLGLFFVVVWQCVDDSIAIERASTIDSARDAWLAFAELCGWEIPLASATIKVCGRRIEAIFEVMASILTQARLPSGLASSLVGRLMFACVAFAGFFGKSMLRAFRRRSYEQRANMNLQILASLDWWTGQLRLAPPPPPYTMDGT